MNWFSLLVMYLIIWWVVLFAVLPIGVKGQAESDEVVKGSEVLCPASKEAGRRATCDTCKLCAGASIKAKSIAIVLH